MTALVIAEHDNNSIKTATLNTVTAAKACETACLRRTRSIVRGKRFSHSFNCSTAACASYPLLYIWVGGSTPTRAHITRHYQGCRHTRDKIPVIWIETLPQIRQGLMTEVLIPHGELPHEFNLLRFDSCAT